MFLKYFLGMSTMYNFFIWFELSKITRWWKCKILQYVLVYMPLRYITFWAWWILFHRKNWWLSDFFLLNHFKVGAKVEYCGQLSVLLKYYVCVMLSNCRESLTIIAAILEIDENFNHIILVYFLVEIIYELRKYKLFWKT